MRVYLAIGESGEYSDDLPGESTWHIEECEVGE